MLCYPESPPPRIVCKSRAPQLVNDVEPFCVATWNVAICFEWLRLRHEPKGHACNDNEPTKKLKLEASQHTAARANQCTRKEVGEQVKMKSSDENIHSPHILYVKVKSKSKNITRGTYAQFVFRHLTFSNKTRIQPNLQNLEKQWEWAAPFKKYFALLKQTGCRISRFFLLYFHTHTFTQIKIAPDNV